MKNSWPYFIFSSFSDIFAYTAFVLCFKIFKSWKKDCSYRPTTVLEILYVKLVERYKEKRKHLPIKQVAKRFFQVKEKKRT